MPNPPTLFWVGVFVAVLACGAIYVADEYAPVRADSPLWLFTLGGFALAVLSLIYALLAGKLKPPVDKDGQ